MRRGLALPFALFFVGLIFCLTSLIATEALSQLRWSSLQAHKLELQAVARGAVEYHLEKFNRGQWLDESEHRDHPPSGNLQIVTQLSPLQGNVFRLEAKVSPSGGGVQASATCTVRKGPNTRGVAYAQLPGSQFGGDAIDTILRFDEQVGEWRRQPQAQLMSYNVAGQLNVPGGPPRTVPFGCADQHGNLYLVVLPTWDFLMNLRGPLGQLARLLMDIGAEGEAGLWELFEFIHAFANFSLPLAGPQPVVMKVTPEGACQALPPLPGKRYDNGRVVDFVALMPYQLRGLITQASCDGQRLFLTNLQAGADLIYWCDLGGGGWQVLAPPPYGQLYESSGQLVQGAPEGPAPYLGAVTQDEQGHVFAHYGDYRDNIKRQAVFMRDITDPEGDWQRLPCPPRSYYSPEGELVEGGPEDGAADNFCYLRSSPGGELYGLWFPTPGNGQILKFAGGVWSAVRPPRDDRAPNALDVDAAGNLLVKYPDPGGPDALYRIQGNEAIELARVPSHHFLYDGTEVDDDAPAQTVAGFVGGGRALSGQPHLFRVSSF